MQCSNCLNDLVSGQEIYAFEHFWHRDCFRCSICDCELSDWYFKHNQDLFCKRHYMDRFSERCQRCEQNISGPVMAVGDHKFHPECFQCNSCNSHIGDGEVYVLLERTQLFCGKCRDPKDLQNLSTRLPSIQLVKIQLIEENRKSIKLTVNGNQGNKKTIKSQNGSDVRISSIDENAGLSKCHLGDKILEVNGMPVNNASMDSIEELIYKSSEVLQLIIEREANSFTSNSEMKSPKERLYKKKDDIKNNVRTRQLKKAKNLNCNTSTNNLKEKERSSSMSKLISTNNNSATELYDLSRTKSFRLDTKPQKIFRASDLVQGELLGKGFFGQVFKVTEKTSGEVMVIKELYRVDEEAQRNFLKEVAVLKSLHHSNVLKFIGVLYRDSKLHLVTEYVPGGSLNEIIQNLNKTLPYQLRIGFAKDIASGMAYLHSKNIIHRDLNSLNCLVREDQSVIVADFGLARIISQPARYKQLPKIINKLQNANALRQRKQRYTVVGNPYWMAPEMMKGDKYDEKVDIFSFGIILCELIGRVQADPDYLPRASDFSLDEKLFIEKFCHRCPEAFSLSAFLCCDLNPDKRPTFNILELWLSKLRSSVVRDVQDVTISEIKEFMENNGLNMQKYHKVVKIHLVDTELAEDQNSFDDTDLSMESHTKLNIMNESLESSTLTGHSMISIIPRSPHFSREFSDTGERIRDSFRARRRRKMLQNKKRLSEEKSECDEISNSDCTNNIILCDTSESEPLSLIEITSDATKQLNDVEKTLHEVSESLKDQSIKEKRPHLYGNEAFVIKVNDGILSINNIKNIDNVSDLDSSCDTSLNFTDSASICEDKSNYLFNPCSEEVSETQLGDHNPIKSFEASYKLPLLEGNSNKNVIEPKDKISLSNHSSKWNIKGLNENVNKKNSANQKNNCIRTKPNNQTYHSRTTSLKLFNHQKNKIPNTNVIKVEANNIFLVEKKLKNIESISYSTRIPNETRNPASKEKREHIANRTTESTRAKSKLKPVSNMQNICNTKVLSSSLANSSSKLNKNTVLTKFQKTKK